MDKIELMARIAHAGWCAFQMGAYQDYNVEPNTDQLNSTKDAVRFYLENPNASPEENHENWLSMKTKQGWVYGEVKDFEKKTHPDMRPYDELPEVEKKKDTMNLAMMKIGEEIFNSLEV